MADSRRLFEVEPREQVGSGTGNLYEYQYHQAAASALNLIDKTDAALCVYCEWHDDYVLEAEADGLYTFCQVKTRGSAWTVGEFFGLGRTSSTGERTLSKSKKSCIFSNLWDHTQKFDARCHGFVFLSDAALEPELQGLLDAAKTSDSVDRLTNEMRALFLSILNAVEKRETNIDEKSFLAFLRKLCFRPGVGSPSNLDDARAAIVDRILQQSEVDLKWSEGRKMGADLVTLVRSRSHLVLNTLASSEEELRSRKGVGVADVLNLLSLSEDGFRLLKKGEGDVVRTLSRLHRFCHRQSIPEQLIPQLCEFKTDWSGWWLKHADMIEKLDFATFKMECLELLKAHSNGNLSISDLGAQAKSIAGKYTSIFHPFEELTGERIMGLIISLAVEAEGSQ